VVQRGPQFYRLGIYGYGNTHNETGQTAGRAELKLIPTGSRPTLRAVGRQDSGADTRNAPRYGSPNKDSVAAKSRPEVYSRHGYL